MPHENRATHTKKEQRSDVVISLLALEVSQQKNRHESRVTSGVASIKSSRNIYMREKEDDEVEKVQTLHRSDGRS